MTTPAVARAYAKVNLLLSAGPPEPAGTAKAGWHPICTWMAGVSLWDDVEVTPLGEGEPSTLRVEWAADALRPTAIDWPMDADLSWRAHQAVQTWAGRALPAAIAVRKRIPVGAGLGGGSSDAAAVIRAMNAAFALNMDDAAMTAAGSGLGSDVGFFCGREDTPRPAIVEGFGERLGRTPPVRGRMVLVVPEFSCPTPEVYRAFDGVVEAKDRARRIEWGAQAHAREQRGEHRGREPLPHAVRPDLVRRRIEAMDGRLRGEAMFNDLQPAAIAVRPALGEILTSLKRVTRLEAHVTGSGSGMVIPASRGEKALEQARRVLESHAQGAGAMLVDLV
jgi:4-diphosphocytidyl-2-C-methyl-D-erythritol kinase